MEIYETIFDLYLLIYLFIILIENHRSDYFVNSCRRNRPCVDGRCRRLERTSTGCREAVERSELKFCRMRCTAAPPAAPGSVASSDDDEHENDGSERWPKPRRDATRPDETRRRRSNGKDEASQQQQQQQR